MCHAPLQGAGDGVYMQPQYGRPIGPGLFQPPSAQSSMPVAVSLPGGGFMTAPAVVDSASIYPAPVSVYQGACALCLVARSLRPDEAACPCSCGLTMRPWHVRAACPLILHTYAHTSVPQLASQAHVQNEAAMQIGEGGRMAMPRYADFVLCFAYLPILGLYLFLFSEVGFGATVFKTLTQAHEFSIFPAAIGVYVYVYVCVQSVPGVRDREQKACPASPDTANVFTCTTTVCVCSCATCVQRV
jgi:hypothetical protein